MNDRTDQDEAAPPAEPEGRTLAQKATMALIGAVALVGGWLMGAAIIPRWWSQRVGDVTDGRLTVGWLFGMMLGFVFTLIPLIAVYVGWRMRRGWRRALITLVVAAVLAAPNLMTLGIVWGSGNAAHAGERTLDTEAPGFRGGTLVGAVLGAGGAAGIGYLAVSRRRTKRKAVRLEAELETRR